MEHVEHEMGLGFKDVGANMEYKDKNGNYWELNWDYSGL